MTTSGGWHYFQTLFGALLFKVKLDSDSGKVLQLQTKTNLGGESLNVNFPNKNVFLFLDRSFAHCHIMLHLFLEKLTENQLTLAIGKPYDILSLLDYIDLFMNKVCDYNTDYVNLFFSHKIKMEENHW